MLKTNSKQYLANWRSFLESALDGEEGDSLSAKLRHLLSDFDRVANYPYNLRKFPNVQDRLGDYLQGLPNSIDLPFFRYNVLELSAKLHDLSSTDEIPSKTQALIFENWHKHAALMILRVAHKEGVEI